MKRPLIQLAEIKESFKNASTPCESFISDSPVKIGVEQSASRKSPRMVLAKALSLLASSSKRRPEYFSPRAKEPAGMYSRMGYPMAATTCLDGISHTVKHLNTNNFVGKTVRFGQSNGVRLRSDIMRCKGRKHRVEVKQHAGAEGFVIGVRGRFVVPYRLGYPFSAAVLRS